MSGASMLRPGIQSLLQDAQAGKFDIVLAEAIDRLSASYAFFQAGKSLHS
jgi:site-specific DNA recombinase